MKSNKVLFIDDELNILASLRRELMDENYICFFASSGVEALEILEKHEISVIVTDMKMPKMNGLELLKKCREKYPDTTRIVMSGYTHFPQVLVAINQGEIFKFIPKPWDLEKELKPAIQEGIEYYTLKKKNKQLTEELKKQNELYRRIYASTQDKYTNFKSDIDNIKDSASFIFEIILNCNNPLLIKLFKDFYTEYIDTFPSINEEFNSDRIYEDFNNFLKREYNINNYVKNSEDNSVAAYGNYRLITHVIHVIYKTLTSLNLTNITLSKILIEEKDNKRTLKTIFICSIREIILKNGAEENEIQKVLTLIREYIFLISKGINGKLNIHKIDKYITLEFISDLYTH